MSTETAAGVGLVAEGASAGFNTLAAAGTGLKAFLIANPLSMTALGGVLAGVGGYYAYTQWRNRKDKQEPHEETAQEHHEEAAEPAAA